MVWNIFKNLQYNVYYKAIFGLFGTLLIVSLLFDIKAISNLTLFHISMSSIIYGLVMWIFNDLSSIWQGQMNELRGLREIDYIGNLKKITTLHVVGVLIWLSAILSFLIIS